MVDVANLTLEQDVVRELKGSRHSCAAVLTADKKKDLRYLQMYDGRAYKWLRDNNYIPLRLESNHADC